jgi:hypothetical protein
MVWPPYGLVRFSCEGVVMAHHYSGGRSSTEPTCPTVHWFREQPAIVGAVIGFVLLATGLCFFLGPIGILYALDLGLSTY